MENPKSKSSKRRIDVLKKANLEFYGDIKIGMCMEGDGYYFHSATGASSFDGYPEAQKKFLAAEKAIKEFREYIDSQIVKNGGDPDEYEA